MIARNCLLFKSNVIIAHISDLIKCRLRGEYGTDRHLSLEKTFAPPLGFIQIIRTLLLAAFNII